MAKLLVVDDEKNLRLVVQKELSRQDHNVDTAEDGEDAWVKLESEDFDVVLCDINMPRLDGIELLRRLREKGQNPPEVIMLTGQGSVETAIEAMKLGAYDYLTKPYRIAELSALVTAAAEKYRLKVDNQRLRAQIERVSGGLPEIVAESAQMKEVLRLVRRVAPSDTSVLITGESGTGKEIIAQAIHSSSPRQKQAFVAINCGAISESLIESELFGYSEGAFTGAKKGGKTGKFELANNGTLFLDEIGEMPLEMQVKLLRTIQEKAVIRVGSNKPIPVNVRILAATNKNLEEEVKAGRFRLDLFYRLNVFEVQIPPLRDRRDDILPLVNHFLKKISSRFDIPIPELKPELLDALLQYNWPGNIRELENLMERAVILRGKLDRNQISHASDAFTIAKSFNLESGTEKNQIFSLEENEKNNILKTIRHFENNISKSAEALGISRNTLYQKMKKYDLLHVSTFGG